MVRRFGAASNRDLGQSDAPDHDSMAAANVEQGKRLLVRQTARLDDEGGWVDRLDIV